MKKDKKPFIGLHILGEIKTKEVEKLKSLNRAKKHLHQVIKAHNFHKLGSFYCQFPGGGFTGVISLAESHISIHTWPELKYLTLDVYICNYSKDNSRFTREVFKQIATFFNPIKVNQRSIKR